jgi:bacterioferritin-associated ferredoxin
MTNEKRVFVAAMGEGGDEVRLEIEPDGAVFLSGVGCPELLAALAEWRPRWRGPPSAWLLPEGAAHAEMLIREVAQRALGSWAMPLEGEELCHCRAVPAREVDLAVLRGAKTPATVGIATGAGTQCGTCRPDIERAIAYRAGR